MSTTTTTQTQSNTFPLKIASSSTPTKPFTVPLNFSSPPADGSAPYNYVEQPPEGVPRTNIVSVPHQVAMHDIRGQEHSFSIDKQAFLPVTANEITQGSRADFSTDESTKETYYPEVERLLLETLPGSPNRVLIFDHTIRRQQPGSKREPVLRVHIDQTNKSARERVRFHLPEEAETLLQQRVRLVNVWRPLNGAVESSPLAVADSQTVRDDQILPVQHRYPDRTGETAAVNHDQEKWYYWSRMNNDERLLLQCYDSETGTRVPHTAFQFPGEAEQGWTGKPRESIEVRALVFG